MDHPTRTDCAKRCAVVGIRHRGLGEGIRDLVATLFQPVVLVTTEAELTASADRLNARLAVIDLAFGAGDGLGMIRRLHHRFSTLGLIVLTLDDSPPVRRAVLKAGADRMILASDAADELLPAAEAVVNQRRDERGWEA